MDCFFVPADYAFSELNEPRFEEFRLSEELVDYDKFSNSLNISKTGSHTLEIITPLVNPNMVVPKMTSRSTENVNNNVEMEQIRLQLESQNFPTNIKTEYHSQFLISTINEDVSNKLPEKLFETNITGKSTNTKVTQKSSTVINDESKPIRRRVYSMVNDSSILKMHQHPHSRIVSTRDFNFPKPPYSYSCLITLALRNSPSGKLRVSEIYSFLCRHFPYFLTAPGGWKNSVRHNLSLNKCFEKIEKPNSSGSQAKGCFWTINPMKMARMEEEMLKCSRKDASTIRRSLSNPDDMEALEMGDFKNHQSFDAAGDEVDIDSADETIDDTAVNVPFTFITPNTNTMTNPVEISSKSNKSFLFDTPFHTGKHFSI